jgi:chemotaxis protein histidine kinase CheA
MGGTIDIESDMGKGTTIWVTIPCEAQEMEKRRDANTANTTNPTEQLFL